MDKGILLYLKNYKGYGTEFGTRVDFYDDFLGVVQADCEVKVMPRAGQENLKEKWLGECRIREVVSITQRHQDVRVATSLPVQFVSDQLGPFDGSIVNLSAGGARICTKASLAKNDRISFTYAFQLQRRTYTLQVLGIRASSDEGTQYGCRFVDLPPGSESAIRGYVFRELRSQKRNS
ncbi:MAG: PilZ domain-containing protein [Eubacterium sp.]|nr:PilZ domain-containing protein [Eubacterium sp.]